ncbi:M56 family metallopeptidase [Catalinimonas niigatensis]|uniref:M56 family metallopeptidase n=1 Tax=Catalinimonas niigatensis TaxID=1397264 RepID=UPI0026664EC7|nr:M56 family metallopeptidase [Catalinimonas niigatensis]WPP52581.1 M56 family metallopeptidase [Catalinimonas niigatensis]
MAKLIMYLLESSAILACFYLLYVLVLRKETFFSLNRFFLLGIVIFSLLFPILRFNINPTKLLAVDRPIEEISKFRMSYYEAMTAWEFEVSHTTVPDAKTNPEGVPRYSSFNWTNTFLSAFLVLYVIGIVVCMSRVVWALRRIFKMISIYPQETVEGVKVIKLPHPTAPFSFLKYVFVHGLLVKTPEFDQILKHEKTHIQQRHSVDLIFVQLLAAFLWFNPVIWQLIKSLKTTHEYIADKKIMNSGYSLVEYQTLLLRQLISNNSFGLVHNFNLSFIKKRITMMKSKKSGWAGKVKVAMTIVATLIFSGVILQCNAIIDEQVLTESQASSLDGREVDVPVLPQSVSHFDFNSYNSLNLTISGNKVFIHDEEIAVEQIRSLLENSSEEEDAIVLQIDKHQSMGLVREVQWELRKANRLKIIYIGQTSNGEQVGVALRLPPDPEHEEEVGIRVPKITDQYAKEHNISLLKVEMGEDEGPTDQQKTYDFVKSQVAQQNTNFVISARFSDDASYKDYLISVYHLKEAFYQIYDERAQALYGKPLGEISKKSSTNEEHKEMYETIRLGIPMAISIAED